MLENHMSYFQITDKMCLILKLVFDIDKMKTILKSLFRSIFIYKNIIFLVQQAFLYI